MPSSGKLIMIVDDDRDICDMLEFIMTREGFRVATALDGKDCLARVQADRPDLIILDLMMPRQGGFEVLRSLQQEGDTAKIPVVVITGRYTDRTTADMIHQEPNVVEFLEKPLNPQAMALTMHKILKTSPLRDPK